MRRPLAVMTTLLAGLLLGAQDTARMKTHLEYLASRELLGRETGQPGAVKAATYLAGKMQAMGLRTLTGTGMGGETPYHYSYTLGAYLTQPQAFDLGTRTLTQGLEARLHGETAPQGAVVFAGYGLAEDLARSEVRGRWVMVLEGHPGYQEEGAAFLQSATLAAKTQAAREAGALGLVLLADTHAQQGPDYWNRVALYGDRLARRTDFPVLTVTPEGSRSLDRHLRIRDAAEARRLGTALEAPELPFRTLGEMALATTASNIVGLIPGTDATLASEYLLVTAHYDHIGGTSTSYYPGADDNASGTSGLLELAQLLVGSQPKRSILFVAMSGEEKGLLGSEAFASRCPISLSKVVGVVNLDMLGRNATRTVYVTPAAVSGQVNTLVKKARELAATKAVDLSKGIDQYWQQSDHYSFAKRGIPVVFFNSGNHSDLHQTTDTVSKIDYEKMARIVDLAKGVITHFANSTEKPVSVASSEYNAWTWPVRGNSSPAFGFTQHPQAQTVAVGATVTFSSSVTGGTAPYAYQWYRNGVAIPNATGGSYSFGAQLSDDGALFKVTAKDSSVSGALITSNQAKLTVTNSTSTLVVTPATATVEVGATFQFTASMSNGSSVAVNWTVPSTGGGSISTSGLYTAPATPGTYKVRATSVANTSLLAEATVTVTPKSTATEKLVNGGFESGTTPWTGTTGAIGNWSSSGQPAFEGTRAAWLGGNGRTSTETLTQTVTLPSTASSATLTFQLHIDTKETGSTVYDKLSVQVLNSAGSLLKTLATYSNVQAAAGYQLRTFDLSAYKGQTVRISFKVVEDAGVVTNFLVDKVSLLAN